MGCTIHTAHLGSIAQRATCFMDHICNDAPDRYAKMYLDQAIIRLPNPLRPED